MNKPVSLLFLAVGVLLLVNVVAVYADGEVFDGNTVYVNDSRAFISATPHTIQGSGWVENVIESKSFSGNVNWVMLTSEVTGEYFKPTRLQYYDDDTSIVNGSLRVNGWVDVPRSFIKNNVQVVGKNRAYAITNIPVTAGVPVRFRYYVEQTWFPPMFSSWSEPWDYDGKYDIAVYPSSYGANVRQAYDDGNLYLLDPTVNLTDGIHLYYSHDVEDVSGTTLIDGVGTMNATLNANPVLNVSGIAGTAIRYEGNNPNNHYAQLTGDAFVSEPVLTIMAWIYPEVNGTNMNVFSTEDVGDGAGFSLLTFDDAGTHRVGFFSHDGSTASGFVQSNVSITTDTWYHLAVVSNGTSRKLYLNAELVGSRTASGQLEDSIRPARIAQMGNDPESQFERHFEGVIDELYVYKRAFSIDELSEHYNRTLAGDQYPFVTPVNLTSVSVSVGDVLKEPGDTFSWSVSFEPLNATVDSLFVDFGDGTNSSAYSGFKSYASVGNYSFVASITDISGNTLNDTVLITVAFPVTGGSAFEFESSTLAFLIGILIVIGGLWMGASVHPIFFSFAGFAIGGMLLFAVTTDLLSHSFVTVLGFAFSIILIFLGLFTLFRGN